MDKKMKDIKREIKYFFEYKVWEKFKYGLFYKIMNKKGFSGYLLRVFSLTVTLFIVACILKLFLPFSFVLILRVVAAIPIIIGYGAVSGGFRQTTSMGYITLKGIIGEADETEDVKLRSGATEFCVFLGMTSVMLYLISLIF